MKLIICLVLIIWLFVSTTDQLNLPHERSTVSQFASILSKGIILENEALIHNLENNSNPPLNIKIPGVSLNLPIKEAAFTGKDFEFFENAASFLISSANPGKGSNVVLYAHNEDNLFKALHWTAIGDTILIKTENNIYEYRVEQSKRVTPKQVEVIKPTKNEILTLITCTGINKSHRLIIIAEPTHTFARLLEEKII